MMRPFKSGDTLQDHAVPVGEVMQQLQTQLAEYRALKEQIAVGAVGPNVGPPPAQYGGVSMHSFGSMDSNLTSSASSSFLQLPGPSDTPRSFDLARNGH